MTRYTNPFHVMNEIQPTLRSLGLDPDGIWAQQILDISFDKKYTDGTHFYSVSIQLTNAAYRMVKETIGVNGVLYTCKTITDGKASMLTASPSANLEFVTVVPIDMGYLI